MFEEHQKKFLQEISSTNIAILVEGKKDRDALKKAGLENIIEISGKSIENVAEIIKSHYESIIVLTDYDDEGTQQYKRLRTLLVSSGVKVDDVSRQKFKNIFLINRIEEMNGYFK